MGASGAASPISLRPGPSVRPIREEVGLTQEAPAERLGTSQQTVAQGERWTSNPTVAFLSAWVHASDANVVIDFHLKALVGDRA